MPGEHRPQDRIGGRERGIFRLRLIVLAVRPHRIEIGLDDGYGVVEIAHREALEAGDVGLGIAREALDHAKEIYPTSASPALDGAGAPPFA